MIDKLKVIFTYTFIKNLLKNFFLLQINTSLNHCIQNLFEA